MTVSLTCQRCQETIEAADEEELVTRVQTHVRTHGSHPVSRRHVLNRLHRQEAQHDGDEPTNTTHDTGQPRQERRPSH